MANNNLSPEAQARMLMAQLFPAPSSLDTATYFQYQELIVEFCNSLRAQALEETEQIAHEQLKKFQPHAEHTGDMDARGAADTAEEIRDRIRALKDSLAAEPVS